jgi:hypothetical protein
MRSPVNNHADRQEAIREVKGFHIQDYRLKNPVEALSHGPGCTK